MTKKQIDDLAEIMANKVIEKIEAKQKEWEKEFERNMQKQQDANDVAWNDWKVSSPAWTTDIADIGDYLNREEKLQEDLKEYRKMLKKAIEEQEYEHCRIIDKNIIKICKKLYQLTINKLNYDSKKVILDIIKKEQSN